MNWDFDEARRILQGSADFPESNMSVLLGKINGMPQLTQKRKQDLMLEFNNIIVARGHDFLTEPEAYLEKAKWDTGLAYLILKLESACCPNILNTNL